VKNTSLVFNLVLLVAVGVLYYLHFKGQSVSSVPVSAEAAAAKIVYVNSDSLMDNYGFFKELQDRMEKRRDSLDQVLSARGNALEQEIKAYQSKAEGMSAGERQLREESLMRKQQALMDERDALLDQLKDEELEMTDSVHADLMKYLRDFNKGSRYDFILGYSRGGGILLANDSLDVTRQVIEGLNKR
jgi:outer membrane protein